MKIRYDLLIILLSFTAISAAAQEQNTCDRPTGEAYLDIGNVRAHLGIGGMPVIPFGSPSGMVVPKDSGIQSVSCMFTWMGGVVEGEARIASGNELWPGPLDEEGRPPADCAPYDRIFEITRTDLEVYRQTGALSPNLLAWPWQWGAPVADGDGVPGNYNLEGGDLPELRGHQMLWWVMNDAAGDHTNSDSKPLGMEVQVSAFGFDVPGAVGNTTFFTYKFLYKGEKPLHDARFTLYPETDLGYSHDNFEGADTTLHLVYSYNMDNEDQGSRAYGENPPAVGYTFLPPPGKDPDALHQEGETDDFTGLGAYVVYRQWPKTPEAYYNYMRGRWSDGTPITYGGDGRSFSDVETRFFYPGDPVTGDYWSMMNVDGEGTQARPRYANSLVSTEPFTMQPGDVHEITFAITWSQGKDHLDSIQKLKNDVRHLHRFADRILAPDLSHLPAANQAKSTPALATAQNYPNPFRDATIIKYSLPQRMHVRLQVFDVLGRTLATLVDAPQEANTYAVPFDAQQLPSGLYFYRIQLDHLSTTHQMLLVR